MTASVTSPITPTPSVTSTSPLPPGEGQGEGRPLLTEHFTTIASAPNGIKKLRELILEMAVQGKLVPQNLDDEPAGELLKRMEFERQRLIAQKVIRQGKQLPEIQQDEMAFAIPKGWVWVRLGQIGDWGAGATPARGNAKYYGGGIPWFKSGELVCDVISESEESVTELALKECSLRPNKAGDVLVAMYGATIGKTAILAIPATTNQAVCACTPFSGLDNRYLLLVLKALRKEFVSQGAGGAQPNISREKIVATVAALPPEAEQSRILAKVDELMALCDQLETQQANAEAAHEKLVRELLATLTQSQSPTDFQSNWQRLASHFDTLFVTESSIHSLERCLLQLGVMGMLVPQSRSDGKAVDLLEDIFRERMQLVEQGKLKMLKPASNISPEEIPFSLPDSWAWSRLSECLVKLTDGEHLSPQKSASGMPLLTAKDVTDEGISLVDTQYVSVENGLKYRVRCDPIRGDILVCSRGTIGRCAAVEVDDVFCLMGSVILLRPPSKLFYRYLLRFLQTDIAQEWMRGVSAATAVSALYLKDVGQCLIPIPPLEEQHRIVECLDRLMGLCNQLKLKVTQARQLGEKVSGVLIKQVLD